MQLDIKKRYSFKTKLELMRYMLDNKYELQAEDIEHLLLGMNEKQKNSKVYKAICILLKVLQGEQKEALIELINADVEFGFAHIINLDFTDEKFLEDEFVGYAFKSVNKETEKYLIQLAKTLKANKSTSSLEKFRTVMEV